MQSAENMIRAERKTEPDDQQKHSFQSPLPQGVKVGRAVKVGKRKEVCNLSENAHLSIFCLGHWRKQQDLCKDQKCVLSASHTSRITLKEVDGKRLSFTRPFVSALFIFSSYISYLNCYMWREECC